MFRFMFLKLWHKNTPFLINVQTCPQYFFHAIILTVPLMFGDQGRLELKCLEANVGYLGENEYFCRLNG